MELVIFFALDGNDSGCPGEHGAMVGLAAEFHRAMFLSHEALPGVLAGDCLISHVHQVFNAAVGKQANAVIGKKAAPCDAFSDAGMCKWRQNPATPVG
ncbi:hypothetical protein ACFDAU_05570 [Sulfuriferula sp. GW1]|uniref:hypothetical protein n=1 Tax=Sulfuriferula sp. GW1 TaxID=3345111 RepID=UPI0039B0A875